MIRVISATQRCTPPTAQGHARNTAAFCWDRARTLRRVVAQKMQLCVVCAVAVMWQTPSDPPSESDATSLMEGLKTAALGCTLALCAIDCDGCHALTKSVEV